MPKPIIIESLQVPNYRVPIPMGASSSVARADLVLAGREFVKALRSGQYVQIQGSYRDKDIGRCAKGVMHEVMGRFMQYSDSLYVAFVALNRMLVTTPAGGQVGTVDLNDVLCWTFGQIADAYEWFIGDVEKVDWMIEAGYQVTPHPLVTADAPPAVA